MDFVIVLYVLSFVSDNNAALCGTPESPKNGYTIPRNFYFHDGEQVKHVCYLGFYTLYDTQHVESVNITCLGNEIWNKTTPSCNIKDYIWNKTIPLLPARVTGGSQFDKSQRECGVLDFSDDSNSKKLLIRNVLDRDFYSHIDLILELGKISPDVKLDIYTFYSKLSQGWFPCNRSSYLPKDDTKIIVIRCDLKSVDEHSNILIEFWAPKGYGSVTMEICSLKGLAPDNRGCGTPAIPAYGKMIRNNSFALYSCAEGLTLIGNMERRCELTDLGYVWIPHDIPRCLSRDKKDELQCSVWRILSAAAGAAVGAIALTAIVLTWYYRKCTRNVHSRETCKEKNLIATIQLEERTHHPSFMSSAPKGDQRSEPQYDDIHVPDAPLYVMVE